MKTFLRATWKRGSALILALGLLLIAAISIGSLLSYAVYQLHGNARYEIYTSELNAAEYAMNSMLGQIKYYAFYKPTQVGGQIGNFHNAVLNVAAPPLAGYQFSESGVACAEGGDLEYREITDPADPWNGYPTLRIVYELNVRAKRTDPTA
ncbi:MAG: hypothetical protein NTW86_24205, partial [Candidatus Sumerlaeota bacterium]|nr:hypothetical protein [Candidatus Sumerlaeota bacterium]